MGYCVYVSCVVICFTVRFCTVLYVAVCFQYSAVFCLAALCCTLLCVAVFVCQIDVVVCRSGVMCFAVRFCTVLYVAVFFFALRCVLSCCALTD